VSFNVLNRKIHYWASFIVAVPLLVIIATGILLQGKKQVTWVQPAEHLGTGTAPAIDLEGILAATRRAPGVNVTGWDDIDRFDVRPGKGMVKVLLVSGWEVQIDLGTGEVMQTAYRRSDLIESLHDGSFFLGDWTKLGLFLPTAIGLLLLWLGGMWMWWVPYSAKRRIRHRRAASSAATRASAIMAVAALGLAAACGGSPGGSPEELPVPTPARTAAGAPPTFVPLLGHWESEVIDGRPVITSDTTQWNGEPGADLEAKAASLFGAPGPELLANLRSPGAFPIAVSTDVPGFEQGTLGVEFNLTGGESDQIAGLMFDLRPNGEYHYVRYNTRDDDIAIWRFRNGEREILQHGEGRRRLDLGTWYPLVLQVDGRQVSASAAGELTIDYTLDEPVQGLVGVWTKRDSITSFRDLRAR
jgi:hypothetical protein